VSIQTVLALYRLKLLQTPFPGGVELYSDHRDDLDSIPAGGLRYQLRADSIGRSLLANTEREVWRVEVTIARKLGVGEAERTYTEGGTSGAIPQQVALLSRDFWLVTGVYSLDPSKERELEPIERVGKVVRFTAKATIIL